jgi:hypothetical protein
MPGKIDPVEKHFPAGMGIGRIFYFVHKGFIHS